MALRIILLQVKHLTFFPGFDPDDPDNYYDFPISGANSIAIQRDGKIVLGGFAGFFLQVQSDNEYGNCSFQYRWKFRSFLFKRWDRNHKLQNLRYKYIDCFAAS